MINFKKAPPSKKKIALFSHTDMDGEGCDILAKLAFGASNVDTYYCGYNNIDDSVRKLLPKASQYDYCFITDISVSPHLADIIDRGYYNFKLLDHHATSVGLNKYPWCTVSVENEKGIKTCGTELFYKWLLNNHFLDNLQESQLKSADEMVELIRQYDTWDWASMGEEGFASKKLDDLFELYSKKQFADRCISYIESGLSFYSFSQEDLLLLGIEQQKIDSYIQQKDSYLKTATLCGHNCGIVFAERYISELGHRLCDLHPELDFVVLINMNGRISYRTQRNDLDLGKDIASVFGGGGHSGAAGSEFNKDEIADMILKSIFKEGIILSNEAQCFDERDEELDTR